MKRSPLQRHTPLDRGGPIKRKAARRLTRPGIGSDPAYLAWVRTLPCLMCGHAAHASEAHHAGPKRMDRTAVPLCWFHHGDWHNANGNGVFAGLGKAARRAWADQAIAKTQALWAAGLEMEAPF